MNILYIDAVGPFGGASRSLYELVRGCEGSGLHPLFLATKGTSTDWYDQLSADVVVSRGLPRFDNTKHSYYRRLRWVLVFREVLKVPSMILGVSIAIKKFYGRVDIVHCNEITDLAAAIVAKIVFRVPLVCHVRSVQASNLTPKRSRLLRWIVERYCDHLIYIDENVRSSFFVNMPTTTIHNSSPSRLAAGDVFLKWSEGVNSRELNVVFFGNLQGAKGLVDLLEAFKILKERGETDIKLSIFGGNTYKSSRLRFWALKKVGFSTDALFDLNEFIKTKELSDIVFYKGYEHDPAKVFKQAHLVAFLSHYDAPGRPIFEAGFFGVPSITSISDAKPDTFIPGVTGVHIPPGFPVFIADELLRLKANRGALAEMGAKAYLLACTNHDLEKNCAALYSVYKKLVHTLVDRVSV